MRPMRLRALRSSSDEMIMMYVGSGLGNSKNERKAKADYPYSERFDLARYSSGGVKGKGTANAKGARECAKARISRR